MKLINILAVAVVAFLLVGSVFSHENPNVYLSEVNGPACPLCTLLVSKVRDVAEQYEGFITDEFKQAVCSRLPSATQNLCNEFVSDYGPKVIDALLKKLDPETVCHKIGLCDDKVWFRKYVTDKDAYLIYMELQQMGASTDYCGTCKYIVAEVEQYANSSREELEHKLVHACELIPGSLQQLCDTVVLLYGPQILDYILKYETPEIVCHQIGLCSSAEKKELPIVDIETEKAPVPQAEENDGKCELCKYVVELAEEYIQGNRTEEKIKEALHKVCNKFAPIAKSCNALVDQYEPMLIDFILQKLPPAEACGKIGFCPKKVEEILSNEQSCPLCKFVVSSVEEYMAKNETIAVIEEKVHEVCSFLPSEYSGLCINMADAYIPQIIQFLEQKYTPETVCQLVGLCDKTQKVPATPVVEGPKVVQMRTN